MILVIVFALFIVTFSKQNDVDIQLKFYHYLQNVRPIPLYILIFASLLVGIIITAFWGIVERFRLNRTIRNLNRLVRDLRKELGARENPPIINDQLPKK